MSSAVAPSKAGNHAGLAVDLEVVDIPRRCLHALLGSMLRLGLVVLAVDSGVAMVEEDSVEVIAVTVASVRVVVSDIKAAAMDLVDLPLMLHLDLAVGETLDLEALMVVAGLNASLEA